MSNNTSSFGNRRLRAVFPAWLAAVLLVALPARTQGAGTVLRPNIIFILTDDLGYGDVGAFWQKARQAAHQAGEPWHYTPNLDRFAAEGIQLRQHYCAAPVCAPSRASLLLGVTQGHANVRNNQFDKALEANHTLASVLKQAGYATMAIGKWGLQGKGRNPSEWPAYPTKRGFDEFFGYVRHKDGHEHYPKEGKYDGPKEVWDNDKEISATLDKCYTADLWTARAKKWILDHQETNARQPFFIYLAYDTPHAVVEYPSTSYPSGGGVKGGVQWIGEPGHMINTATGTIDTWVHPDYAHATWNNGTDANAPWPDVYKRYATSVRRIDTCVGDLIQLLKDLRIDGNTFLVFSSDNGPSIESYIPEHYSPEFFNSFGPFDGIKRDCWEGGVRMPTMARWLGHLPAGTTNNLPCGSWDWLATFTDLAGLPAPARSDGVSLLPSLTGQGVQRTPNVYIEYFHNGKTPVFPEFYPAHRGRVRRQMQAIRFGDLLGIRYNVMSQADDFEIYNVVTDPQERHNLADDPSHAGLQQEMKDRVLQMRRPDAEARRPYDNEPVPAVDAANLAPGVRWTAYLGEFPWVPEFASLKPDGLGRVRRPELSILPRKTDVGVEFSGFINVPADGEYTFYLEADSGVLLRIHEATVVDADFGYQSGTERSGKILLKAGKHPFRLYYARRKGGTPSLEWSWSGPALGKEAVAPAVLFCRDAAAER